MAVNTSVCAVCDLRHLTALSKHWCPDCEEALCSDCNEHHNFSKASRGHETIPITQFQSLPTFVTQLQQFCIYHNEKYQQYCMKHECPICYKCIKKHGKCDEVVLLDDVVSGVKTSESFRDVEQSLEDILQNIQRIRGERENNFKFIKIQKNEIYMEIERIKMQINTHLDKLKEEIIKELEQAFHSNNDAIKTVISSLNVNEKQIKYYRTELQNIKKYASDLQSFLGMREVQEKVIDNEKRLKSMNKNKMFENVDIQLSIDDKIRDILTTAKTFGSIIIKKSSSANTKMASKKTRQAQITVPSRMQIINTISAEFKQKLITRCSLPRGCLMTRKGWIIFTDACIDNDKLSVFNAKGKTEYVIQLSFRFGAFDIVCLNDRTVAFTNASQKKKPGISILDLNTREITDFVDLLHHSYGIAHDGSSLLCCVEDGVRVISCTDYSITTIPNTTTDQHSYISTHAGKIFFTNPNKHKVTCCLYDGTRAWEFNDEKVLQTPRGITVDDKGNVFVVGGYSCNVIVLTPDGKQYKEILNKLNGLRHPFAISFDKLRNQLLITNETREAFLYKISYF